MSVMISAKLSKLRISKIRQYITLQKVIKMPGPKYCNYQAKLADHTVSNFTTAKVYKVREIIQGTKCSTKTVLENKLAQRQP